MLHLRFTINYSGTAHIYNKTHSELIQPEQCNRIYLNLNIIDSYPMG